MSQQHFLEPVATGSFDIVMRGYDRSQVHDRLDSLGREVSLLQADRDASLARAENLAGDLAAAHVETASLRATAQAAGEPSFQSMGSRISNMLRLAEEEAADIRSVAQEEQRLARTQLEAAAQECARLRREAQSQADEMIARAEACIEQAQTRSRAQMAEEAERVIADAQHRVAGLEAQSEVVDTWLGRVREALATVPTVDLPRSTFPPRPASQPPELPATQYIPMMTELDHRQADRADHGDHRAREAEGARHDLNVLAREDILEYRHTRRRVR